MFSLSLNGLWLANMAGVLFETAVPGCWETAAPRKDYAGEVTLSRKFTLSESARHYDLVCRAVSYQCEVLVNGQAVGAHEGMWDSFRLDVTSALRPGENEVVMKVYKPGYREEDRYHLRSVLTGFIPDVCCTFGGIWDDIAIEGYDCAAVDRAYGDGKGVHLLVECREECQAAVRGRLLAPDGAPAAELLWEGRLKPGRQEVLVPVTLDSPRVWSPQERNLYSWTVDFKAGETISLNGKLAFRTISSEGPAILMNGSPVYWRGILHWGYYPDRIIPRASDEEIRGELGPLQAAGFNAVKHCLYIPRQNYLDLCDELGIMCWIELPIWLPRPSAELEGRVRREFAAITDQLLGHPCVAVVTLGCEMNSGVQGELLQEMYGFVKDKLGVLVRDNSGSGECYGGLAVDYADFFDYHFYGELQNMENLEEVFTPGWRSYRPWLFGEYCDSDTLREMGVLRRECGVERFWWESPDPAVNPISLLKPDFFLHEYDSRVAGTGIPGKYGTLKGLSYDHSLLHRKVTVEQTRAFPEIAGYDITSIRDVPIATSGVFDDLGAFKFPPEEFRRFNSDLALVPAYDLTRTWINADRVYTRERYSFRSGATYGLHILLSNYSAADVAAGTVRCRLLDEEGRTLHEESGSLLRPVRRGEVAEAYYLHFPLPETKVPRNLRLVAELDGRSENVWPVFLYPAPEQSSLAGRLFDTARTFWGLQSLYPEMRPLQDGEAVPPETPVVVTDRLTKEIRTYLEEGGKVLLCQTMDGNFPARHIAFWREGMTEAYDHPVLAGLKRLDYQEDLRYFGVTPDMALDSAAAEKAGFRLLAPIVRRYDCREWHESEYMAEYACGRGRLIATTFRLSGGQGKETPFLRGNVFGRYLLDKSVEYLVNENR